MNSWEDKRIFTLSKEKPAKAVLKMWIPVTIWMLFMAFYNLIDTYFIGLLHDDFQLAAVNLAYPIMMILVALAWIVGNWWASYIARCLGAKDTKNANHTLTIWFELIVISSIIITIIWLIFQNWIVNILWAKANTFQFTKDYTVILLLWSIFTMWNYAIWQLLRSEWSTFQSMIWMIVWIIANIILDPIFIFTFNMGVKWAAIATILWNLVSVIIYIYYYVRKKTILTPSIKLLKFDKNIIKEIMLVWIPHTLEQFFTTVAMIVLNNLAVIYGEITIAAMWVANKIMTFWTYIYQWMAAWCQPLIGYNYWAKNYSRMKELIKSWTLVSTAIEIVIMILFWTFAPYLISVFSNSEEVIHIWSKTLRAFIWIFPFVSSTSIVRNTFNAIWKPLYAFSITFIRQLILYIPFLWLFNKIWQYDWLIFAQPMTEFICMFISLRLLFNFLRKQERCEKIIY